MCHSRRSFTSCMRWISIKKNGGCIELSKTVKACCRNFICSLLHYAELSQSSPATTRACCIVTHNGVSRHMSTLRVWCCCCHFPPANGGVTLHSITLLSVAFLCGCGGASLFFCTSQHYLDTERQKKIKPGTLQVTTTIWHTL